MIKNLPRDNKLFGTDTTDELNSAFQSLDDKVTNFQAPDKEKKVPVTIIQVYSNHPQITIVRNQSRQFGDEKYFDIVFKSRTTITAESILPILRLDIQFGNIFGHIQYGTSPITLLESYITGTQVFGRFPSNTIQAGTEYRFTAVTV